MSGHSLMRVKNTTSAHGIMQLIRTEMEVPGVAQVMRPSGGLTGLTVEKDAAFQVGNSRSATGPSTLYSNEKL